MFAEAIEKVSKFTRPIHTISRVYGSNEVVPGAATIFLINDEGWALTCRHVIQLLASSTQINQNYSNFKTEIDAIQNDPDFETKKTEIEQKYNYGEDSTIQIKNTFMDCVDTLTGFTWHVHPKYDLALLKFNGFNNLICNEFPIFKDNPSVIKQGDYLCRLGYPFPEFTNYKHNNQTDDIEWTNSGAKGSPKFPIEGMVTRFLSDSGRKMGIELSTPGLRGQSGGPLFDNEGIILGMQYSTKHLHLGFDIENKEIRVKGRKKQVNDYSFIHLGQCIHVSELKRFMTEKGVSFNVG